MLNNFGINRATAAVYKYFSILQQGRLGLIAENAVAAKLAYRREHLVICERTDGVLS